MSNRPYGITWGASTIVAISYSFPTHHIHLPEIELLGPTEARAIVPMEDVLIWEKDGEPQWAHGYGHYHQSFRKVDRGWVITDHKLTRQYLHQGSGHFELAGSRALADPRFNQALTPLPRDFP